jgi:hypothetical protein
MEEAETPATRVKSAREQAGLPEERVANLIGLNLASYADLELHADEIFMCVSLGQLRSLCGVLGTRLAVILGEPSFANREPVALAAIVSRLQSHLQATATTVEAFEDKVGWRIQPVLDSPTSAAGWNLDQLRDVCSGMGVDWREMLPA